jgi:phosphate/sulfate permease
MPDGTTALLWITVAVALGFDFTNGFHDTANAVATSISTRALRPRVAVAMSALLNLSGAVVATQLLHTRVADTIGGLVKPPGGVDLGMIIAALVGAIVWNLITWRAGLPSSSSYALIGGLIGMGLVGYGFGAVQHGKEKFPTVPLWVVIAAALAIGLGTYAGGWRIIRTMGSRIIRLEPDAGFAAQTVAAMVIQGATQLGLPVSTTHVVSGSVMGAGATRRLSAVRWGIARRILVAWVLTIPASALVAGGIALALRWR